MARSKEFKLGDVDVVETATSEYAMDAGDRLVRMYLRIKHKNGVTIDTDYVWRSVKRYTGDVMPAYEDE